MADTRFNKSKGGMYVDVQFTTNPLVGRCPHRCADCYAQRMVWALPEYKEEPKLREHYFRTGIPLTNCTIFVGSMIDILAKSIPDSMIERVLEWCLTADRTVRILLQSRNPRRFFDFLDIMPETWVLGTTIETFPEPEWYKSISSAPPIHQRVEAFSELIAKNPTRTCFVSVEPALTFPDFRRNFDGYGLADMLGDMKPSYVSIGALTGKKSKAWRSHMFPFPNEIEMLVCQLRQNGVKNIKVKENILDLEKRDGWKPSFRRNLEFSGAQFMGR